MDIIRCVPVGIWLYILFEVDERGHIGRMTTRHVNCSDNANGVP